MIQGFFINHPNGGTTYGVASAAIDREEIAEQAGVEPSCVHLFYALDLVEQQYDGIAFLTTETGL